MGEGKGTGDERPSACCVYSYALLGGVYAFLPALVRGLLFRTGDAYVLLKEGEEVRVFALLEGERGNDKDKDDSGGGATFRVVIVGVVTFVAAALICFLLCLVCRLLNASARRQDTSMRISEVVIENRAEEAAVQVTYEEQLARAKAAHDKHAAEAKYRAEDQSYDLDGDDDDQPSEIEASSEEDGDDYVPAAFQDYALGKSEFL